MRNLLLIGMTFVVGAALIGCGGGLSEEKVNKVYTEAFDAQFKAMEGGKTLDANKSYDDAAKANGFKDYKDFCEQGAKWDATKFGAALTKATEAYSKRLEEHAKKKGDEATKKAEEGAKKE